MVTDSVSCGTRFGVRNFDVLLRKFLGNEFPEECVPSTYRLQISAYQTIELRYQSREHWRQTRDLLHSSPDYFKRPRYDCAVVRYDDPRTLAFVRLRGIFRCALPSGKSVDLAVVHPFRQYALRGSSWKPRTIWRGCRVDEEIEKPEIMTVDYGSHHVPVFEANGVHRRVRGNGLFFFTDSLDADMFLRYLGM
ncbi:hypothetical protein PENSPDRAFT_692075 [Peniophora sp. CONT]|nr:hypothetical protein PENSPDRAFT_692075 [Peniophora sp. CONT]